MWGISGKTFQGVTDLTEAKRSKDLWWNSVLDEMRTLSLTVDSHAFFHGKPTRVAGSWCNGVVECGQETCAGLEKKWSTDARPWKEKQLQECDQCKEERRTKCRLRSTSDISNLFSPELELTPCAVPSNDL